MKNGLLIFVGLFTLAALSWAVMLLAPHRQYGGLGPAVDPVEGSVHPYGTSGLAAQGRLVYQDLGCATCHTQQVRLGTADLERKWGARPSYARDYVKDGVVLLGSSRLGPDLRNVGARLGDVPAAEYAEWFHKVLYAPSSVAARKPAHPFLYDVRPVNPGQASHKALRLTGSAAPAAGFEVVPTPRAEALVAYLTSLKDTYEYPDETKRNAPPPADQKGGH
ncbi:MAG TPA: cbb3-type cytochrome c oxidase subunit II [Opitutaceae bacterium]|nr:cbb3-type cytochrome c oxidase subunit II [Opitutaceae bacterium]